MRKRARQTIAAIAALAALTAPAVAADAVCSRLNAQLESISTGAGASANFRRYADAAAKQEQQIRKVQIDMDRYGCTSGSFIVLGGRNAAVCQKLSGAHSKMRSNLRALERKRDSYASRADGVAKRRVEAALKANGCNRKSRAVVEAARKGKQQRASSPGLVAILGDSGGRASYKATIIKEPPVQGGNYRTLCVRLADGYFFPVSSSAAPGDFARDERACKMMCPGTKVSLYYHSIPDEESEAMVSARTREAYTALPTAFAYLNTDFNDPKRPYCNMGAFHREMARREALLNGTLKEGQDAPVKPGAHPTPRPDPGADPETVTNSGDPLDERAIKAVMAASTIARPADGQTRNVRMVGPVFLPDASESLDLKIGQSAFLR